MGTSKREWPAALRPREMNADSEAVGLYAELTADFNPIHVDADHAARSPFGRPIAHGTMSLALLLEAVTETFGGGAWPDELDIRFVRPLPVGATARAGGRLSDGAQGRYEVFVETDEGARTLEGVLTVRRREAAT